MNYRHDLFLGNDEKDRHTISREDSQKGFFLTRLHAIAFTGFLNISVPHVENLIAVDLPHRDDAPIMDTHSLLHIADILADDLGVVANSIRDIESSIRTVALAAAPAHKAVQQSLIFLPLRNLKPRELHDLDYGCILASMQACL